MQFFTATVWIQMAFFASVVVIVLFSINKRYKTRELEHKERMLAIEKGQPLPMRQPEVVRRTRYPLAWPLIILGFGVALLILHFSVDDEGTALAFGLIALFIGTGWLASRFIGVNKPELPPENGIDNYNRYSSLQNGDDSNDSNTETEPEREPVSE